MNEVNVFPAVSVSDSYPCRQLFPLVLQQGGDVTDLESLFAWNINVEQMDFTVFRDHLACIVSSSLQNHGLFINGKKEVRRWRGREEVLWGLALRVVRCRTVVDRVCRAL